MQPGTFKILQMDGITMNKQNGFTLIEVMIALVVLLTGMLGVMSMQYYAISGNASSREMRVATGISQQIVEQIKSTPYAGLASGANADPLPAADTAISGGVDYTTRWWVLGDCVALSLKADDNTCSPALVAACSVDPDTTRIVQSSAIRVRTCWTDKDGSNRAVTLDSLRWNENA
jgi:prepilin-type N-terminal cleavage/methylation domain-containing protein